MGSKVVKTIAFDKSLDSTGTQDVAMLDQPCTAFCSAIISQVPSTVEGIARHNAAIGCIFGAACFSESVFGLLLSPDQSDAGWEHTVGYYTRREIS
jgi:hypothetical protein